MSHQKKIITFFLIIFLFSFIFIPHFANAQSTIFGALPGCFAKGDCEICDMIGMIVGAAKWVLGIVGVLALLLFIYGGFTLILSAGSDEAVKKGKEILIGTLIGMFIVFAAWQIVWLTIASLKGGKDGLTILGKDWSNICAEKQSVTVESAQNQPANTTPKTIPLASGSVGRGIACKKNKDCITGLTCATHLKQSGIKICIHNKTLKKNDSCIPVSDKKTSECKSYTCNNGAPGTTDCNENIICGKCP
mgnify:FL=1